MARRDWDLDRLLRSAGSSSEMEAEAPFGFVTRIVALWRSTKRNDLREITRFVRVVGLVAIAVTVISGTFAYRQVSEDNVDSLTNDYAIAEPAIQSEFVE